MVIEWIKNRLKYGYEIETCRGVVLSEDGSTDYSKCKVKECNYEHKEVEEIVEKLSNMNFSDEVEDVVDIVENLDVEYVLFGITGLLSQLVFIQAMSEYNDNLVAKFRNELKKFR